MPDDWRLLRGGSDGLRTRPPKENAIPSTRLLASTVAGSICCAAVMGAAPAPAAPPGAQTLASTTPVLAAPALGGGATADPQYTFVAAPDFLNQDVGDVRRLPGWDAGEPNSWTPQLQSSVDTFLDEIAVLQPESVLVAGDLVEGYWLEDVDATGVFGPGRTPRQREQMLRRAGSFYESTYLRRFTDRDLVLHAAVGDHDIGDDPWSGNASNRRKHGLVGVYKELFADHFTQARRGGPRYADRPVGTPWQGTAYAVRLDPDVLLVTLDVFHVTKDDVALEVVDGQLAWLRDTLERARARGTKWILVQGHTPIATPVRVRNSTGLRLARGTGSPLWRTMARYGVDVYLSGEVHDTTMVRSDGITQISTGGLLYLGAATYMAADIYADRLDLDVREFDWERTGRFQRLWQLGDYRTSGARELVPGSSRSVGSLTLTGRGRIEDATGKLVEYR